MRTALSCLLLLLLVSCVSPPSPRVQGLSQVRPVTVALKRFHDEKGTYPERLEDLRPHYLNRDIALEDNTDLMNIWRLQYSRIDTNDYWLALYSEPCSQAVFDKTGKLVAAYGPNWSNKSLHPTPR